MKTQKTVSRLLPCFIAAGLFAICSLSQRADAGVTVTWEQVGQDLKVTYSGSMSLLPGRYSPAQNWNFNNIHVDNDGLSVYSGSMTSYSISGGLSWYGISGSYDGTMTPGSIPFGVDPAGYLNLSSSYSWDTPLEGSAVFSNTKMSDVFSQGAPVNYTLFDGAGNNDIIVTSVPEPSSLAISAGALAMLGMRRRRK